MTDQRKRKDQDLVLGMDRPIARCATAKPGRRRPIPAKNTIRKDALHQYSRKIVDQYQTIIIGDVSSIKLVKTRMAKSVLDAGWGTLKKRSWMCSECGDTHDRDVNAAKNILAAGRMSPSVSGDELSSSAAPTRPASRRGGSGKSALQKAA
jgi:transposase